MAWRLSVCFFCLVLALGGPSCKKSAWTQRAIAVDRNIRTLTLRGHFEIVHTNDSVPSLLVEGEEHAVSALRIRHIGDSLYLEGASVGKFLQWRDSPLRIRVGLLPTGYLRIVGGGSYRFATRTPFSRFELRPEHYVGSIEADVDGIVFMIRAEDLYGEVTLRGKAVGTLLKTDGGHTTHAENLHARWMRVQAGSRSGIYVRASEQLAVSYWLAGATVHYYGNPKRIVVDKNGYSGYVLRAGS